MENASLEARGFPLDLLSSFYAVLALVHEVDFEWSIQMPNLSSTFALMTCLLQISG